MSDDDWFVIRKELAEAYGKQVDGGFLVRAGSTAMREGSPKVKRDRDVRAKLLATGILVPDENPALFRFSVDHVFSSQSTAAGVVIDGNSNGSQQNRHLEASGGKLPLESGNACGKVRVQ